MIGLTLMKHLPVYGSQYVLDDEIQYTIFKHCNLFLLHAGPGAHNFFLLPSTPVDCQHSGMKQTLVSMVVDL